MTNPYRSRIDPDKQITRDRWVVSLVAKEKGKSPEHAFIIVEGLTGDNWETVVFRRYDFVPENQEDARSALGSKGLVYMKEVSQNRTQYDEEALGLFFWGKIMNDIGEVEGAYGASWEIFEREEAVKLHEAVKHDEDCPPDYHILGKYSMAGISSSNLHRHNCYSWASAKLRALNDEIEHDPRLAIKLSDFVGSQTTRHLKPPSKSSAEPTSPGCFIL